MIKLIISDMDGCFLNDKKQLHPDTIDLIKECKRNNIHFCIASGRSFEGLIKYFESVINDITLICDNGAMIYHHNKLLSITPIKEEDVTMYTKIAKNINNVVPILTTPTKVYMQKDESIKNENIEEIKHYYPNILMIDDILEIKKDVLKISIYDMDKAAINSFPVLSKIVSESKVILSAEVWVDVINPDVNKGTASISLQKFLKIKDDDVAVFGDYLNDLEMIKAFSNSYAPNTAHPELLTHAKNIIESNDKWSVYYKIKELIKAQIKD
ncbi:MAG: Cof-type HAD-IIB family hydrolase [Anaerorhabdus sp.]